MKSKSIAESDTRLRMQYIGVLTLLGRVARHLPMGDEDRYGIDKAFREANNWLLVNDSDLYYAKSGTGYAAFERSQLARLHSRDGR